MKLNYVGQGWAEVKESAEINQEVKRQEDQSHTTGLGRRARIPEVTALTTEEDWSQGKAAYSGFVWARRSDAQGELSQEKAPGEGIPGGYFHRETGGLFLSHLEECQTN